MPASLAAASTRRLPTAYVNHGGGPMPLLGDAAHAPLIEYLKGFSSSVPKPKALLVVTAHWEESVVTLSNGAHPDMVYDYYGFPPETYKFKYPAPGAPSLAQRAADLLQGAGIKSKQVDRGFDHGTFVPLMLMYPDANIPVLQVSLHRSLDAKMHLEIGQALAPLRDEGVLIIGSGFSFHNMGVFRGGRASGGSTKYGQAFKEYLIHACVESDAHTRDQLLANWKTAPGGVEAHPREEHLIPLMVAAGAAGQDKGRQVFEQDFAGCAVVGFMFGSSIEDGSTQSEL